MVFDAKGCFIKTAETAEEGLRALEKEKFNIIISDLRLPGMNGLDFLKLTGVTHPNAIRFLITSYRDDLMLSKAISSGIDQFIDKPFAVNVLINLLAVALKQQAKGGLTELN